MRGDFCGAKGRSPNERAASDPRAGEEGGHEFLHLPARLGQPLLKVVGQRKQALHSPHDFLLLGERSDWNGDSVYRRAVEFHLVNSSQEWRKVEKRERKLVHVCARLGQPQFKPAGNFQAAQSGPWVLNAFHSVVFNSIAP